MEYQINNIKIDKIDNEAYSRAREREDELIKPPKSLGVLEDIACKICGITGNDRPELKKKRLIVFASDNGVYEEGVSSCPQKIT